MIWNFFHKKKRLKSRFLKRLFQFSLNILFKAFPSFPLKILKYYFLKYFLGVSHFIPKGFPGHNQKKQKSLQNKP